jgi:prophage antirepressor-like protein
MIRVADDIGTIDSRSTSHNYGDSFVRIAEIDNQAWFVAADVCKVLGISKYRDAVARLDDDERGSLVVDTLGGPQKKAAINESGLYSLIFASRKPDAKDFRRWVTHEVLPAIRMTGRYEVAPEYVTPKTMGEILADEAYIKNMIDMVEAELAKSLRL